MNNQYQINVAELKVEVKKALTVIEEMEKTMRLLKIYIFSLVLVVGAYVVGHFIRSSL